MELNIAENTDELNEYVAEWMVSYIQDVLETKERFTIVLSGGNTPKQLYKLLATEAYQSRIDWEKIHVFWGDERYVPANDERNNAKMAFDSLLSHVPIPPHQIHRMRTDIDVEASAKEYEKILHQYFDNTKKSFDLVLNGMGNDAHTLSLFPGYTEVNEEKKWVTTVFLKEQNMQRITLTAPVVNKSAYIAFLVAGKDKAKALKEVIAGDYNPAIYPAQVIQPVNGELIWFIDEEAASLIEKE